MLATLKSLVRGYFLPIGCLALFATLTWINQDSWVGDLSLILATFAAIRLLHLLRSPLLGVANHFLLYWGLLLLLALMCGWVGYDYGLQALVFHDSCGMQVLNGMSTALHAGLVFFLIYALDDGEREKRMRPTTDLRNRDAGAPAADRPNVASGQHALYQIQSYVLSWSVKVCTGFAFAALCVSLLQKEIGTVLGFILGLGLGLIVWAGALWGCRLIGFETIIKIAAWPKQPPVSASELTVGETTRQFLRLARLPLYVMGITYLLLVICHAFSIGGYILKALPIFVALNIVLMLLVSIAGWLESRESGTTLLTCISASVLLLALNGTRLINDNRHKFYYDDLRDYYARDAYIPLDFWLYQNLALRYADIDGNPQELLRSRGFNTEKTKVEGWVPADTVNVNSKWFQSVNECYRTMKDEDEDEGESEDEGKIPRVVVVITSSGGGIRSGLWTAVVLRKLEEYFAKQGIYFPAHVRLATGASGGMLALSRYVESVPEPTPDVLRNGKWKELRGKKLSEIVDACGADALTPVVNTLLFRDIPGMAFPVQQSWDRGRELESGWIDAWVQRGGSGSGEDRSRSNAPLEQTLRSLRQGEKDGWRPSIAFTPMFAEDGRRLIISNLDLSFATRGQAAELVSTQESVIRNDGNELKESDNVFRGAYAPHVEVLSCSAVEFFRLFPDSDIKLAAATRMSASFPFVAPAVSLPTIPMRHVVDAGYYDNYGVNLAAQWIFANRSSIVGWDSSKEGAESSVAEADPDEIFAAVLLVRIRDHQSAYMRKNIDSPDWETRRDSKDWEVAYAKYKDALAEAGESIEDSENNGPRLNGIELGAGKFGEYVDVVRQVKLERSENVPYLERTARAAMRWITTPWDGVNQARQSSMMFRNDEQVESINDMWKSKEQKQKVMTVVLECPADASLSWYLSNGEKEQIVDAVGSKEFEETLGDVMKWWKDMERKKMSLEE